MPAKSHGLTTTPERKKMYNIWCDVIRKCYKGKSRGERYVEKGIKLQDSWLNSPTLFVEYLMSLPDFDMTKSLDRINTNSDYKEGNLRWATAKQQAHNRSMQSNNTSGVTGVKFRTVDGNTYVTAVLRELDGKQYSKTFSVNKLGLLPAFRLAVLYRQQEIARLNSLGAGYSDEHGK